MNIDSCETFVRFPDFCVSGFEDLRTISVKPNPFRGEGDLKNDLDRGEDRGI